MQGTSICSFHSAEQLKHKSCLLGSIYINASKTQKHNKRKDVPTMFGTNPLKDKREMIFLSCNGH